MKQKLPKIVMTGIAAVESARPLFVRALDGRWVPGDARTRERAQRMEPHALWIYGVEAAS